MDSTDQQHDVPACVPTYVGRFAPSPTGPLHMGSLLAALASFLDARAHQGDWLLRIEDLDPPREQAGAAERIVHSLQRHQLHWQGDIVWQSRHHDDYKNALDTLLDAGHAYHCRCSRKQLQATAGRHLHNCNPRHEVMSDAAIRLRLPDSLAAFQDRWQGHQAPVQRHSIGDPVLRRRDGLYAYQLAVVIDDARAQVSDVVRGADLLELTAVQIHLQSLLGLAHPRYLHIPLLCDAAGQKLSKQNHAAALDDKQPSANLLAALRLLGLSCTGLDRACPADILAYASEHWLQLTPRTATLHQDREG